MVASVVYNNNNNSLCIFLFPFYAVILSVIANQIQDQDYEQA